MTKYGGTFKFSGETRDLLKKNQDFFGQISDLHGNDGPDKIPLRIMGKDPESRTEAKIQANGDVEVSFVYSIDDNSNGEDGRIYLRDTFVFDSSEQRLKSVNRSAEYNGKGQGNWQAWFEKHKATVEANPLKIDDLQVQKFAQTVVRSFGRPVTDENGATLPEIRGVLKKDPSYVTAINELIVKQREQHPELGEISLKIKDKKNFITVLPGEESFAIVINFAVDSDDDPKNGRIWLKDRFTLDPKTMAFVKLERSWELAPESGDNPAFKAAVEALQQEAKPGDEEAKKFIQGMAPVLLTGADRDAANGLPKLVKPLGLPKDYQSPLAKRLAEERRSLSATPEGVVEALEAMAAVSQAALGQRHDASLGWWDNKVLGKATVDLGREESAILGLFQKAAEHVKTTPTASALGVLRALKVDGVEAALRDQLLTDPRIVQLDSIGRETDAALRAQEFLSFARHDLANHFEYAAPAVTIAQRLSKTDGVKAGAEQILALAQGKGSIGAKMEILMPRFSKQVADWKMLVAMGAAPIAGTLAEGTVLRTLAAAGKVRSVGSLGRFTASVAGLSFEATAFTAMHKGLESAVHDPAKVWAHAPQEILGAALLFGTMRLGHGISGRLTRQMSEGKWGSFFGGKTAGERMGFVVSPTGRVLEDQLMAGSLTKSGRLAGSVLNHGSGVTSMYLAGALGRKLGIHPEDKRNLGEHWFDAALMYTQATMGFSLANSLTGGRLQGTLAELKIRTAKLAEGAEASAPAADRPERNRPITLKPKTGLQTFKLKVVGVSEPLSIDVRNLSRVWIGRRPGGSEGVSYADAGMAQVNVGEKYKDVNQMHAILLKDEKGVFWYIGDCGSVYGTYVNGKKLGEGEFTLLEQNALIELGDSFRFRLETDGKLLEPDSRVPTEVKVPVPSVQRPVEAPKPADVFPMDVMFPDSAEKAESNLVVASLKSANVEKLFRTGKPVYNFSINNIPVVRLYVDAKGRWVVRKLDSTTLVETIRSGPAGERRWTLEKPTKDEASQPGVRRQDWVFLLSGDKLQIQTQVFDFNARDKPEPAPKPAEGPVGLPRPKAPPPPPPTRLAAPGAPLALDPAVDPAKLPKPKAPPPPPPKHVSMTNGPATPDGEVPSDQRPTLVRDRPELKPPSVPPPPPARDPMLTPVASEVDATGDSVGDRPTLQVSLAEVRKAVGEGFDSEPTRPGVPMPIDMPDKIPSQLLATIPPNEAPFTLVWGVGDSAISIPASREYTRYVLGSNPTRGESNQVEVKLGGHRISPNHAEIILGRKVGEQDFHWFLATHPENKESKVYIDGYRALGPDERVILENDRHFSLGDPKGERGGIQLIFKVPSLKNSAPNSAEPKPASVFPKELVSHLEQDQPTMGLRSNFGSMVLTGDRKTTRYILGSGSAKPAGDHVAFHQLVGEKFAPEHAEIFVDAAGQWYLKVLSDTHPTYYHNKQVEAGSILALKHGDPIELGGSQKDGVGIAVIFHKPEYRKPARDSSQPDAEQAPDSDPGEPVSSKDLLSPVGLPENSANQDLAKTVVPPRTPPPLPLPRLASPPPPPNRPGSVMPRMTPPPLPEAPPAGAKPETELKTGVFSVRPELLAASALGDVEPAPVTVQAGRTPPPEAVSPKAKSEPPPAPKPEPEESFAGMAEEVNAQGDGIETMSAWDNPPRQVSVADRVASVPPPPAVKAAEAVLPPAADLAAWHPNLTNQAILEILRPFLKTDRKTVLGQLKELQHFPSVSSEAPKILQGSTLGTGEVFSFFTKLTGYDVGFESGKGEPGAPIPKALKDRLFELIALYYLPGKFKNTYQFESDLVSLKFSAFATDAKERPNTLASLPLKQGVEMQAFEGIFEHLLTLGVPIEVVSPLNAQGMKRPYIGVFYRAQDASTVHAALETFVAKHAGILAAEHQMPFSHPIADANGTILPGVGITEHASDNIKANLMEMRIKVLATAYSRTIAEAKSRGAAEIDLNVFMREALKALDEAGFDLNNPGFLKGSPEGSHRAILGGDPNP